MGCMSLAGCKQDPPTTFQVGLTNGSTKDKYVVPQMTITTVRGGQFNVAMGAVSGYPGKRTTGGTIHAPIHIEGNWVKGWDKNEGYYRISADFPANTLAKMQTMAMYYKNFDRNYGALETIVDGPRVRVFFTMSCY